MEGVPWDVITTSNTKEDTIMNIEQMMVNSNARAYHERGGSEKRAMWSSKGLNVSMYLKKGYMVQSALTFSWGFVKSII